MGAFHQDVRERRGLARNAKYKKNGSKSKRCTLPSDYLTPGQIKKLSKDVVTVNFNYPVRYPKFKAAIYCSKPQQAHEVAGKLRSLTGTTCLVRKFNTWSPNYTFEFPNGSRILVRVPSETVRGYRQHAIYVDDFVSDEMKELTRHYLIKYDTRFL